MRGDSLRDFYAKTLALIGLGVLAGAGALVDYWPVGVGLPRVAPALELPPQAPLLAAASSAPEPVVSSVRRVQPVVIPKQPEMARVASLVTFPATESSAPLGAPVTLSDLSSSVDAAPDAGVRPDQPVLMANSVDTREWIDEDSSLFAARQPVELAQAENEDGFITGAFKKTGTSIVRTSVRTGTSIVDAVRVVSGVVRRALPN